jgi:hypothetical protein
MEQVLTHDKADAGHGKPPKEIEIRVNHNKVVVTEKRMTGLQIKDAAIAQHVNIRRDFVLIKVAPNGKRDTIGDNDEVTLHDGTEFEAIADDDNS